MELVLEAETAHFVIGKDPQILVTRGIGSCVAICLYDKVKKVGALAHIMLSHSEHDRFNPLRFADTALPIVLEALHRVGVDSKNLQAHIIGGASMFPEIEDYMDLGNKNVETVMHMLETYGIPIITKNVGGHSGRNVKFFLNSGEIEVLMK